MSAPPPSVPPPTFILGCVRSGTTLLRNLLRRHPDTACPEETQYYRWGSPFATDHYAQQVARSGILARHRALDGIDEAAFQAGFRAASGRRELMLHHMALHGAAHGALSGGARPTWFDKSPQNVYGLPLLLHDFPEARFVHIVRNPLNVAASLIEGVVVAVPNMTAAANYWFEAVAIINTMKPLLCDRLYEVRYEDLTGAPARELAAIARHMKLDPKPLEGVSARRGVHAERNRYRATLKPEDYPVIEATCGTWAAHYGYDLSPGGLESEGPPPAEAALS